MLIKRGTLAWYMEMVMAMVFVNKRELAEAS
jgi:hypothetical protein